jgi:hypothetical protein
MTSALTFYPLPSVFAALRRDRAEARGEGGQERKWLSAFLVLRTTIRQIPSQVFQRDGEQFSRMNFLGAPASRRPVASRKSELAGETPVVAELCPGKPVLPGTAPRLKQCFEKMRLEHRLQPRLIIRPSFAHERDGGVGRAI